MTETTDLVLWEYNLAPGRDARALEEVDAILDTNPAVVVFTEAIGYQLPDRKHHQLVRDRSKPGRANIAMYVHNDLPVTRVNWVDLHQTWARTQHPGTHDPRSFLDVRAGRLQLIGAHQPPKGTSNVVRSQQEGVDTLVDLMTPWRRKGWDGDAAAARVKPRAVLMDANRRADEAGPGPAEVARRIGGETVAPGIDTAVVRGGHVSDVRQVRKVAGLELQSDHDHALRLTWTVPEIWTHTKEHR